MKAINNYFIPDNKQVDAIIRADFLNNLSCRRMPIEQAIAISSLQLANYWCNGFQREADKRLEEARNMLIKYAYNFPDIALILSSNNIGIEAVTRQIERVYLLKTA